MFSFSRTGQSAEKNLCLKLRPYLNFISALNFLVLFFTVKLNIWFVMPETSLHRVDSFGMTN
ncbi:hypothetical protein HNP38_003242 [Chryseobacterium defluvii]|uniref:Uncharacterized protein n=1 Tax=Chryseobacterium defluvii TaxID=160396 RepID=A0A840KFF5_9FLAO|nr:hypothetical protein [Chryseobacterium defluvii]